MDKAGISGDEEVKAFQGKWFVKFKVGSQKKEALIVFCRNWLTSLAY